MATQFRNEMLKTLDLPDVYEDLSGIVRSELKLIATALSERAAERLFLTPRQTQHLKRQLYNRLAHSINETMAPLTVERQ